MFQVFDFVGRTLPQFVLLIPKKFLIFPNIVRYNSTIQYIYHNINIITTELHFSRFLFSALALACSKTIFGRLFSWLLWLLPTDSSQVSIINIWLVTAHFIKLFSFGHDLRSNTGRASWTRNSRVYDGMILILIYGLYS